MNYTTYYFSGTGNTKLIAAEIIKAIENKRRGEIKDTKREIISIENLETCPKIDLKDSSVIGVGFPVHKFTFPRNFELLFKYLEKMRKEQGLSTQKVPLFLFCTYARFPANSLDNMNKELEKLGFDVIHTMAFKCPSNGIASLKNSKSYEYQSVMYFEKNIDEKIENFAEEVIEKAQKWYHSPFSIKPKSSPMEKLKLTIVESVEHTKYPQLQIDDSCVNCGACGKTCPEHNLVKENDHIRIIDPIDCLHCLRCMNYCPQKSISFGELTTGPKRYTPNVLRKLYNNSITGKNPELEREFKSIVKQWRRDTLKYWIQHREKNWLKNTRKRMRSRKLD